MEQPSQYVGLNIQKYSIAPRIPPGRGLFFRSFGGQNLEKSEFWREFLVGGAFRAHYFRFFGGQNFEKNKIMEEKSGLGSFLEGLGAKNVKNQWFFMVFGGGG